jgi:hypothetical protein
MDSRVSAVDTGVGIGVLGSAQSSYVPDPHSHDAQEILPILLDASNNVQVRGSVLTDETSFREDFSSSSLYNNLTGTLSFVSGGVSVTGVGTYFTTEISIGDYVRLGADTDSALTQVAYVVSDTELVLEEGYLGATSAGSGVCTWWSIEAVAPDSSIVVSNSLATLTVSTSSSAHAHLFRQSDYLPLVTTFYASISQRIAGQKTFIGVVNKIETPTAGAYILWDGTDPRKITCVSLNASNSYEESQVTLPGELLTSSLLEYQIEVSAGAVAFLVDSTRVASHRLHVPDPYQILGLYIDIQNTTVTGSPTALVVDSVFFQNTNQVQTGSIFTGEPQAVQGVPDGVPITIQFGNPGGGTALPLMINMVFDKSEGAIVASSYKRVQSYSIPTGYTGYIIRYVSFQGEAAASRIVAQAILGTFVNNTQVFTVETSYPSPTWAAIVQAEVTTQIQTGAGSVAVTVTYTNELGVSGRTGTISIPRGSAVGSRWSLLLQTGDIGVRSVQNVTSTSTVTGAVKLLGLLQLAVHQDQSTTTQTETLFAPGAITFPSGTVLGIEYAGGVVAKQRTFDALIQLVQS